MIFLTLLVGCQKSEDVVTTIELNDRVNTFRPNPYKTPSDSVLLGEVYVGERELTMEEKQRRIDYTVALPAANMVMGRDSFQIGVEFFGGKGTGIEEHYVLFLNAYGDTLAPMSDFGGARSRGLITSQSVFAVEKNSYWLMEVDSARSILKVKSLEDRLGLDPIARLSVRMKRLPLMSLQGDTLNFTRPADKKMLVFFVHFPLGDFSYLAALDRHWASLSEAYRAKHEVIVVHRFKDMREELRAYLADNPITLPVFFEMDGTCSTMNCYGSFPYFLAVNESGRITEYYGWPEEIGWPQE